MTETISNVAQFLYVLWLLGVAPICTGIVIGWVLPEAIWQWMRWRELRKAKSPDSAHTPGSP